MGVRLRTIRDVRVFSVSLTAFVMLGNLALQSFFIEPELAAQVRWHGLLKSFILAAPLTYFVGLRLYEIHRLNVDIKQAAQKDQLTGLLSRHAFIEKVRHLKQCPGVLIIADIDHFKAFNDSHGHAAGDDVLRKVAKVLRSYCRSEDLVARFGGEEFLIFVTQSNREEGIAVAERLRTRLARNPISLNDRSVSITASFGVAVMEQSEDIVEVMARADAALYASKDFGRNRVSAAP